MNKARLIATVLSGGSVPWYRAGGAPAPLAVWVGKGAASLAASYVNLVNPGTNDLTVTIAPTLQANGWLGNNSAFLVTDIVPALTYSIFFRVSGQEDALRCFGGTTSSATQLFYIRHGSAAQANFRNGNVDVYIANGFRVAGVFAMCGKTTFIDGVQQTSIAAGGSNPTHAMYLMGYNNAGAGVAQLMRQGHLMAAAVYASTLTPAQAIAVSVAMAAI